MATLLDELKRAIERRGESLQSIARGSGVAASQLSRMMTGKRGLSLDAAERLADYLGLQIKVTPKRRRK